MNLTPRMTFPFWWEPFSFRRLRWAVWASLKTMARVAAREQIEEFSRIQKRSKGQLVDTLVSFIPDLSTRPTKIASMQKNVRLSVRIRPETRNLLVKIKNSSGLNFEEILNWVISRIELKENDAPTTARDLLCSPRIDLFLKELFSEDE